MKAGKVKAGEAGKMKAGTVCPAVEQVPLVRARHSVRVWMAVSLETIAIMMAKTMAKTMAITITMTIAMAMAMAKR